MDNLTHTLIGALVGETAHTVAPSSAGGLTTQQRRNLFLPLMVIGSNLPDLDFLYARITGNRLDYLLEHRGHSHTVIGALFAALLMLAACELWMRLARRTPARRDRLWFATLAALAPLLHVAMDWTNSYGVHPFWPFDNRWLYGDAVFIVEPSLWTAAAPLALRLRTIAARAVVWIMLFAGIALSIATGLVPRPFAVALAILTVVMLTIAWRTSARTSLFTGVGLWLLITAMFVVASSMANRRVDMLAAQLLPQWHTLDRILTPMPVNPVCWSVLMVQSQHERYALRRAVLSLAPQWLPAQACPTRSGAARLTAPLSPAASADTAAIAWHGDFIMGRAALTDLVRGNCVAAGLMKFARAPFVAHDAERLAIGDLRFDNEPGLSFAEFVLEGTPPCPSYVPPWVEPRQDLLEEEFRN